MKPLPTHPSVRPFFVYGTLRPGQGNARTWLGWASAYHDGAAYVVGYRLVSNGGFPYMVAAATSQTVGALIVPDTHKYELVQRAFDNLEGYRPGSAHNHYERVTVPVIIPGPAIVTAWTYIPADVPTNWRTGELLPEVPTNAEGFHDWNARRRLHAITTERN